MLTPEEKVYEYVERLATTSMDGMTYIQIASRLASLIVEAKDLIMDYNTLPEDQEELEAQRYVRDAIGDSETYRRQEGMDPR